MRNAAALSAIALLTVTHPGARLPLQAVQDVAFATTPPEVVEAMLALAGVGPDDVVYDLGCGDGRIVVAAAKLGARGVGVESDPALVAQARALAEQEGVAERTRFDVGNLFGTDVSDATVVMLYLQPEPNLRLRPRLRSELPPGARVVSHSYDMGDWAPDEMRRVAGRRIYLWTIPPR